MKPHTLSSKVGSVGVRTRRDSSRSSGGGARSRSGSRSRSASESDNEPIVKKKASDVHKNNNGFHRPSSNTRHDNETHDKLKEMALDVKSDEAKERGDFKNFNLPKELVEKLKGLKKT